MVGDGRIMIGYGCIMVDDGPVSDSGTMICDGGVMGECVSTNICDLSFSSNCNILAVARHHKKERCQIKTVFRQLMD